MSTFLARYLEDCGNAHFRASLLGSLSDNLLTTGGVAGTFLSCAACGTNTTTRGIELLCEHCGAIYDLKPDADYRGPGTRLVSRSLERRRASLAANWFLLGEDWSVADLFHHLLRLPADQVVPDLCAAAGRPVAPGAVLEHVLFWPRLMFGGKTIQPDVVVVFDRQIVLFEFKKPAGADLPGWEIAGQVAFAHAVEQDLGHDWTLFVVPGPRARPLRTADAYAAHAHAAQPEARAKYRYSETLAESLLQTDVADTAAHIRVHPWESVLEYADQAAAAAGPSWQARSVRHAIREWHRVRAASAGFAPLAISHL